MLTSSLQFTDEMRATMTEVDKISFLIQRAQDGDHTAFEELTSSASNALLARIKRRMGIELKPDLDPEDVMQETFFRAFQSISNFQWQGEGSFESWLYGIALKIILHSARERGKWHLLRVTREPQAEEPTPSRHHRREERFDRLQRSLDSLRPEYRRVVQLARIEGLSIAEIAERMNRTPSSVRNLLFRAMKQLRESFGDTESLGLPDRFIEEDRENGIN